MIETLKQLVEIPSPSGMTDEAIGFVEQELMALGIPTTVSYTHLTLPTTPYV